MQTFLQPWLWPGRWFVNNGSGSLNSLSPYLFLIPGACQPACCGRAATWGSTDSSVVDCPTRWLLIWSISDPMWGLSGDGEKSFSFSGNPHMRIISSYKVFFLGGCPSVSLSVRKSDKCQSFKCSVLPANRCFQMSDWWLASKPPCGQTELRFLFPQQEFEKFRQVCVLRENHHVVVFKCPVQIVPANHHVAKLNQVSFSQATCPCLKCLFLVLPANCDVATFKCPVLVLPAIDHACQLTQDSTFSLSDTDKISVKKCDLSEEQVSQCCIFKIHKRDTKLCKETLLIQSQMLKTTSEEKIRVLNKRVWSPHWNMDRGDTNLIWIRCTTQVTTRYCIDIVTKFYISYLNVVKWC